MDTELKRKLAAILVADVVGFSRLVSDDEEATLRRLEVFRTIWQDVVTRCNGRIFNTAGDSILAEFQSAVEAVRCAVDFQAEAKRQNDTLVAHRQMHFRVGITIGDVVERGSDLLGDGVNVAARLQTLSGAGGICVSSWVREAVANKLGVKFTDLGDQNVKNIPTPIRAYKVASAAEAAAAVAGGSSGPPPPLFPSFSMPAWLGRAVSSWHWLAALAAVAAAGTGGTFYFVGKLRTPAPAVTSPQSPLGNILREIDTPKTPATVLPDQPKSPEARPKQSTPPPVATPKDASIRRSLLTEAAERELKPGDRFKECDTCPEMVVIPTGEFTMGSSANQPGHEPDETPVRKVAMTARIAVARYPVTVEEFDTFITVTGYRTGAGCRVFEGGSWVERLQLTFRDPGFPQAANHPAVCVNWNDAKAYTDWMSARQRSEYRLPSEAEREYVTRGGQTTAFWWGDKIQPSLAAYDWSSTFAGSPTAQPPRGTHPVAAFAPNPFGLVQVHGNVSEWVEDCWNDNYRGAPSDGSAWMSGDCKRRVMRDGAWGYSPKDLRAAAREGVTLTFRNFTAGFRVVKVLREGK
jgi:formylglycine-generating enzyme required for sulfatase activity/class 3 adenylate cyclase